jgi:hypothetical protein
MPGTLVSLLLALLVLALLVWAGQNLLALWPGNEKIKRVAWILLVVIVALYLLSLVAGFFGVEMPWGPAVYVHPRR